MAVAMERMGGGFYVFIYADSSSGMTLAAFDPFGCGYAANSSNGKPRLTSRKHGGTFTSLEGDLERLWTVSKPLASPIEFELTPNITFKFNGRTSIFARLSCQGLTEDYEFGELQKTTSDSYLSKSIGVVKMGPERGKQILDIDLCRQAAAQARERREMMAMKDLGASATLITQDMMKKHPELKEIVGTTDALVASVARGDWHVDVFNDTQKMRDTLGDSLPTLRMGDSLHSDPFSKTLEGMPATNPAMLKQLLQDSGSEKKGSLPLTAVLKGASGRYRAEHGSHYKTPRKRLRELKAKMYDTFLKEEAPKGTVVVVACLASWLPQSKRLEPVLELLNGEMYEASKAKAAASSGGAPGLPPPDPAAAAGGPMMLCKYEMSESRFLRDRHNINTLPMFLMYYDGKLAYASNTLNGFGTSRDDLLAQVNTTRLDAQRGNFLPPDFRFGATDNKLTASFADTLSKTSTHGKLSSAP